MATPASDPAATYAYDHSETEWYIEANGVKTLMAKLLKDIVVSKPEDPILHMIDMCKNLTEEDYMPPPPEPTEEELLAYDEGGVGQTTIEELQEMVLEMFLEADEDGNGYLDRKEFKQILQSADLNLNKRDIRNVMAECDENEDSVIEYREFMPVMAELITAARARTEAEETAEYEQMEAQFEAEDFFLRGMSAEELEGIMSKIFKDHDADGNGVLDRAEFKACLMSADLGLTRKEINLLLTEADDNGDGVVEYDEFVPLCFKILVEKFKEDYLRAKALQEAGELESLMLNEFVARGLGENGKMPRAKVKKVMGAVLNELVPVTKMQLVILMGMAEDDGLGMVDVPKFLRAAQEMLNTMWVDSKAAEKAGAIEKLAQTEGAEMLHGMSGEEIKNALQNAFQAVDDEGKGWLTLDQVYDVLRMMGTDSLDLSHHQMNAMLAAVDENDDGMVEWEELVDFVYDVLTHLDNDLYVSEIAAETAGEFAEDLSDGGDDGMGAAAVEGWSG